MNHSRYSVLNELILCDQTLQVVRRAQNSKGKFRNFVRGAAISDRIAQMQVNKEEEELED